MALLVPEPYKTLLVQGHSISPPVGPGVSHPDEAAGSCHSVRAAECAVPPCQSSSGVWVCLTSSQCPVLQVGPYRGHVEQQSATLVQEAHHYKQGRDLQRGLVGMFKVVVK